MGERLFSLPGVEMMISDSEIVSVMCFVTLVDNG